MRAILVLLSTALFIAAPALTPPFTGYPPEMFPVRVDRPFIQPAGYAFSIWGLIYLWLLVHALAGLRQGRGSTWDPMRPSLIAALLLGSAWLAIAGSLPILATLVILVMAILAVSAFLAAPGGADRWLAQAPVALFAGWLTAAASVSAGVVLAGYGWLSNSASALTMLVLALGVATSVQLRRPAMPLYAASVVWAAAGIAVVNRTEAPGVALAALAGATLLAGLVLWRAR